MMKQSKETKWMYIKNQKASQVRQTHISLHACMQRLIALCADDR